jgi:hypothetical protein
VRYYESNDTLLHLIPVGSRAGVFISAANAQAGQVGPLRCHIAGLLRS